jgi:ABC-type glycerol-3-phosphate transport system permease component
MHKQTIQALRSGISNLIIIVLGFAMLCSVIWLIMAAFKEGSPIFSDPGLLPKT